MAADARRERLIEKRALPLSAEQRAELHRRRAEHEADQSSGVPWEQLRAELFAGKRR